MQQPLILWHARISTIRAYPLEQPQKLRHLKISKYQEITRAHIFVPVAVESLGPINKEGHNFLQEIGPRLTLTTGDPREASYLSQRISIANQRYNALAILGCFPSSEE